LASTGKRKMGKAVWGMGKLGEEDGEKAVQATRVAKSGAGYRYEVRVGRVGQTDHTSVAFVWQAHWKL
jgi:hypothetical protein